MLRARFKRADTQRLIAGLIAASLVISACSITNTPTPPTPIPGTPTPTEVTSPATVTLSVAPGAAVVPSYFAGFSIESQTLCQFLQLEQSDPELDQFYQNLGPTIIRIGGISGDAINWQPEVACSGTSLGPVDVARVFAFAQRTHAKIIWSLNLKVNDPVAATDEVTSVMSLENGQLEGIEMGNEPNNWTTQAAYEQSWGTYAAAIQASGYNPGFVGPSMYDNGGRNWFASFVQDYHSQLALVTFHYYPLQSGAAPGSPQAPTIANLLSPALMTTTASDLARAVSVARANGLALEIDEANSINNGGLPGVSNTFASALWGADFLFTAAEHGVLAVNFHGSGGATGGPAYSPIVTDVTTHQLTARPLYYGMLFFHTATGDGKSSPLRAAVSSSGNLVAHAVISSNGVVRVALINKDPTTAARVQVTLPQTSFSYTSGQVMRLLAPSVSATTGVTFGGASVGADGSWTPSARETARVTGSSFTIIVPAGSAALVTLTPQA